MGYEMRRKDRLVTDFGDILKVVDECSVIRLGFSCEDVPYIVPLNFSYEVEDGQLYLYVHGARVGRKYDLMCSNKRCAFEMDVQNRIDCMPEIRNITTRYKSIYGAADIEFVEGEEKAGILENIFADRFAKNREFKFKPEVIQAAFLAKLKVTEMSCKVNPVQN